VVAGDLGEMDVLLYFFAALVFGIASRTMLIAGNAVW
jgi:hypothetical protein